MFLLVTPQCSKDLSGGYYVIISILCVERGFWNVHIYRPYLENVCQVTRQGLINLERWYATDIRIRYSLLVYVDYKIVLQSDISCIAERVKKAFMKVDLVVDNVG